MLVFGYFAEAKSDAVKVTKLIAHCLASHSKIKCVRPDNGTEFNSKRFPLSKNAVRHNSCEKLENTVCKGKMRTTLEQLKLWTYVPLMSAVIHNRCHNRRVRLTPHFMLTVRKPNLSKMNVFGSVCYSLKKRQELESQRKTGILSMYD